MKKSLILLVYGQSLVVSDCPCLPAIVEAGGLIWGPCEAAAESRPPTALTDTAIRNAKAKEKPYKVADSQCLYLLVNPRGSKLWRVKYRINGAERKLALGAYPEITLAEARTARDAAHRQLAHAVDPNVAKRQARIEASMRAENSFSVVAEELIAKREQEGVSPRTLEKYIWLLKLLGPEFGRRPVAEITL